MFVNLCTFVFVYFCCCCCCCCWRRDNSRAARVSVIMHPMPVCSDSDEDIFDCIQRGNVELCVHYVQNDRSVLKEKGKDKYILKNISSWSGQCCFICRICVRPLHPTVFLSACIVAQPYLSVMVFPDLLIIISQKTKRTILCIPMSVVHILSFEICILQYKQAKL